MQLKIPKIEREANDIEISGKIFQKTRKLLNFEFCEKNPFQKNFQRLMIMIMIMIMKITKKKKGIRIEKMNTEYERLIHWKLYACLITMRKPWRLLYHRGSLMTLLPSLFPCREKEMYSKDKRWKMVSFSFYLPWASLSRVYHWFRLKTWCSTTEQFKGRWGFCQGNAFRIHN